MVLLERILFVTESPICVRENRQIWPLVGRSWLESSLMKINSTSKNSWPILKHPNKLEPKCNKDLIHSRINVRPKDNSPFNKPLIENSKWKLMNSGKKRPSS